MRRRVGERVIDTLETSQADELQRVLGASAASPLGGDQHVHICAHPVAHEVDERHLRSHVAVVARVAVEKDVNGVRPRLWRGWLLCVHSRGSEN